VGARHVSPFTFCFLCHRKFDKIGGGGVYNHWHYTEIVLAAGSRDGTTPSSHTIPLLFGLNSLFGGAIVAPNSSRFTLVYPDRSKYPMRVFRTRGLVWPFLFVPMLLVVWLSSSAGVVKEVSAEPVAQTTPIPTITQRQIIEIALNSDDSSLYYTNCIQYESYPPPHGTALNEIYIGYCGTEPQPIVSGLRFNTSVLENIPFEDIANIYIVVAVEKGHYTSDTLAPIAIRGHATTNSPTFADGA
jgi:hypothetical protein